VHHQECWAEVGGCGAYGCGNAPAPVAAQGTAAVTSAWGDSKQCPVCAETIKAIAVKCRFCGCELGTVDPISGEDYVNRVEAKARERGLKSWVVAGFVLSLIGLLAPLMLLIFWLLMLRARDRVSKAGPLFSALAYAALGISAVYSLMMLVVFLSGL